MSMPTEQGLFDEERTMATMNFGDHIEELRHHLILALLGLLAGVVFGLCFQTPLVMLFLSIIGVFTAADYRSKRRLALLIIVVGAMILTPGPDASSMLLLSVLMALLYELGIVLVGRWGQEATV